MNKLIFFIILSCYTLKSPAVEFYLGVGTTGYKAGVAQQINNYIGFRAEYNLLNYSRHFNTSHIKYHGDLKFRTTHLYIDYFPFDNPFRMSVGVLLGTSKIDVASQSISFDKFNNEHLKGRIKHFHCRPYIGLGYGFSPRRSGVNLFIDAGVSYGKIKVDELSAARFNAYIAQHAINEEKKALEEKFDKFKFYPVISLGLSYSF